MEGQKLRWGSQRGVSGGLYESRASWHQGRGGGLTHCPLPLQRKSQGEGRRRAARVGRGEQMGNRGCRIGRARRRGRGCLCADLVKNRCGMLPGNRCRRAGWEGQLAVNGGGGVPSRGGYRRRVLCSGRACEDGDAAGVEGSDEGCERGRERGREAARWARNDGRDIGQQGERETRCRGTNDAISRNTRPLTTPGTPWAGGDLAGRAASCRHSTGRPGSTDVGHGRWANGERSGVCFKPSRALSFFPRCRPSKEGGQRCDRHASATSGRRASAPLTQERPSSDTLCRRLANGDAPGLAAPSNGHACHHHHHRRRLVTTAAGGGVV